MLCAALVDLERTSPGPLSAAHARDERLEGGAACKACHGGWFSGMSESCLACHEAIERQLEAERGLHGTLAPELGSRCALCHSDHHGSSFALVNRRSFALAGVPDPTRFDHALVGFAMEGRHLELGCVDCHAQAEALLLPIGAQRFLGLAQDCASCHDDPHQGRMGRACADCHAQQDFARVAFREHDAELPLAGAHERVDCRSCHAQAGPHALEHDGGPRAERPAPRQCLDCHPSPHAEGFVRGAASTARLDFGASCVECHLLEHESFRDERLALDPTRHAASGFRLDPPHDRARCADCHDPSLESHALRHPGRGPDDCQSCHDDPHGAQFAPAAGAATDCTACHARTHFEPHLFGPREHERAGFALEHGHAALDCRACHADPHPGAPRLFRGTPARCESCHADAHEGAFERFAEELAAEPAGSCSACHLPTRFADVPEQRFDHGRWTGFPIAGAHAQAECALCHPPSAERDATGRSFGRVHPRYDAQRSCAACHLDPHRGAFDGPELPRESEGRASCARCHGEVSFRSLEGAFDHGLWTGFALEHRHAAIGCADCHPPGRAPSGEHLARGPAAGRACAECHADPHVGQFQSAGSTDCARCHQSAASFAELAFDHGRDSRFALDQAHARLACNACHTSFLHEGTLRARYKPLGTECADCHGSQRQPLRKREARASR